MDPGAHIDVLIVGAGPVGMTAAVLLASQGIRTCVVEKNAATADEPKAISLDDESLRVYARAGIGDEVLGVIVPGTGTTYYDAEGFKLFHASAAVPFRSGFPFKNPFAQPDLERALRAALEAHPLVQLRFGTELLNFTETSDGVVASTRDVTGRSSILASYILGADGGRSQVRSILDIPMSGRSHDDVWLVIDCTEDEHRERFGMHHGDPRRPHVIVPGLHGRCRYEFYLYPDEGTVTSSPPFELIEQLLAPHRGIRPEQVERAVAYRFHGLNADTWRRGRAFLVGDAAHMMPPFAGQGLNSGIRDAANLTWKLASVVHGHAAESLLDTYAVERRPHAEAVIRSSERLGRVVMTRNHRLARFRDAAIRRSLESDSGRAFFEKMQYRPTTRITAGAVLAPDSHPLVGCALGQPSVFDFGSHRIVPFDELAGAGWSVIGVGLHADDADIAWSAALTAFAFLEPTFVDVPLDDTVADRPADVRVAIDIDTRLYAEVHSARGGFIVMRPDRVIAAFAPASGVLDTAMRIRKVISTTDVEPALSR